MLDNLNAIGIYNDVHLLKSVFVINNKLEIQRLPRLSNKLRSYLHTRALSVLTQIRNEMDLEFGLFTICEENLDRNESTYPKTSKHINNYVKGLKQDSNVTNL